MSKRNIALLGIAAAVILSVFLYRIWSAGAVTSSDLYFTVQRGPLEVKVSTTGELRAARSEEIMGPQNLRKIGIYQVNITDLVPEGTVVEEGDYVASLDKTEAANKLNELETQLQLERSKLEQAQLDTSIDLSGARNQIIDLKYAVEEAELELNQSQFEPPAVQKQAEIALDKARRAYAEALSNYQLRKRKAAARIYEIQTTLNLKLTEYNRLKETIKEFTIYAPKGGMVIYARGWGGDKLTVGSSISAWNPVVATLPDLSRMLSRTYVNEVDISKVKTKQKVDITVDAFPDRKYSGVVRSVANVGQSKANSSAKVFEVEILLNESDTSLRPSMTTANVISVASYDSVLYVPLECIAENDTGYYVFVKDGKNLVRKEIIKGPMSENYGIVEYGLEEGDKLIFDLPEDETGIPFIEIEPEIKEKFKYKPQKLEPEPDTGGDAGKKPRQMIIVRPKGA